MKRQRRGVSYGAATRRRRLAARAHWPALTTYGRFRYLRTYDVFLLVTSSDAVYFYKHTAGGP